jgi:hypothetical protein
MAILSQKDKKTTIKINKKSINEKKQAYFFEWCSEKINVLKLPMLCGRHFCPFPPISQVELWPQVKRAAIYRVNCQTRLLSAPTELEYIFNIYHVYRNALSYLERKKVTVINQPATL